MHMPKLKNMWTYSVEIAIKQWAIFAYLLSELNGNICIIMHMSNFNVKSWILAVKIWKPFV